MTKKEVQEGNQEEMLDISRGKESLKCILTETEVLEAGRKSAQVGSEIVQKEDELTAVKSQFKAEIDRLRAQRSGYDILINNGWEFRSVDIEIQKDYQNSEVRTKRLDTWEVFRTKTMTAEERQRGLALEPSEPEA